MRQFKQLTKKTKTLVLRRYRVDVLRLRRQFGYKYFNDLTDKTLSACIIENGFFFDNKGRMF